jgi:hypothetical protein
LSCMGGAGAGDSAYLKLGHVVCVCAIGQHGRLGRSQQHVYNPQHCRRLRPPR